jgi:hypothetical protein
MKAAWSRAISVHRLRTPCLPSETSTGTGKRRSCTGMTISARGSAGIFWASGGHMSAARGGVTRRAVGFGVQVSLHSVRHEVRNRHQAKSRVHRESPEGEVAKARLQSVYRVQQSSCSCRIHEHVHGHAHACHAPHPRVSPGQGKCPRSDPAPDSVARSLERRGRERASKARASTPAHPFGGTPASRARPHLHHGPVSPPGVRYAR